MPTSSAKAEHSRRDEKVTEPRGNGDPPLLKRTARLSAITPPKMAAWGLRYPGKEWGRILDKSKPRATGGRKTHRDSPSQPGCRMELNVSTSKCETAPARGSCGFTLVELVVVIAVIGVVAAIVLGGIESLRKRASFTGAVGDIVTSLRKTRAEAFGRGIYTAFIVDTVGGRWWAIEAPNGISLSTFNPSAPGTVILTGSLPNGTVFGPTGGYGLALADPFAGIPILSGQSPNLNYCSFCNTGAPNQGFGEILFEPAGSVQFSGGPPGVGQQFTLQGTIQSSAGVAVRTTAVTITALSGVIEQFDQ